MPIDVNGNIISGTSFNTTGDILNEPSVVTDDLVLWYDAGNLASYLDSYDYYDCGYGCQYYASDPGCTSCNTQWKDMSGYANDGTLQNISAVTYGDYGGYFYFNGSNYYVTTPYGANITPYYNPITIECWVKLKDPGITQMFISSGQSRGNGDSNQRLYLAGNSGNWAWGIQGSSWNSYGGTAVSTNGNWNFISVRINDTGADFLLNGEHIYSKSITTAYTLNDDFWLGIHDSSYYLNGNISLFRIYNKFLSTNEVLQNFNNGRSRFGI
jgi:hypothetical protein